jgi:hypothetical protein
MQKTKIFNRAVAASLCLPRRSLAKGGSRRVLRHANRAFWLQLELIAHKVFPGLPLSDDRKSVTANQNFRRQWSRIIV